MFWGFYVTNEYIIKTFHDSAVFWCNRRNIFYSVNNVQRINLKVLVKLFDPENVGTKAAYVTDGVLFVSCQLSRPRQVPESRFRWLYQCHLPRQVKKKSTVAIIRVTSPVAQTKVYTKLQTKVHSKVQNKAQTKIQTKHPVEADKVATSCPLCH